MMCKICGNRATNRYLLGFITDNKYLDLCENCSYHNENTPSHIPNDQIIKYLKIKINGK